MTTSETWGKRKRTALGDKVEKWLSQHNKTHRWLAGEVGVSPSYMSEILRGGRGNVKGHCAALIKLYIETHK